ncbi:MAG: hypothetical protein DRI46_11780 [Chloroflexi bacterium]|nr:MAG: hypothetical protein DRI46_11780 [Chloroflexota bacterium]
MATSVVQICNIALSWLGGALIISLDDPSVEAKLCKANYEPLRDAVLEEREWTFAVKRLEYAQLQDVPLYGFDKAFQIPPEVIRVLQVSMLDEAVVNPNDINQGFRGSTRAGTGQGRETRIEWLREGSTVVANNAVRIVTRSLVRVNDTTKFSPAFDQALAARMAMDLAIPITNSEKMQKSMAQMYGEKMALAAATDGMQGRSYNTRSDSLTIVR